VLLTALFLSVPTGSHFAPSPAQPVCLIVETWSILFSATRQPTGRIANSWIPSSSDSLICSSPLFLHILKQRAKGALLTTQSEPPGGWLG